MSKLLLTLGVLFPLGLLAQALQIQELGRYTDGREAACEIAAYDALNQQLYITNAATDSLDIIDVSDVTAPQKTGGIDVTLYGGGINSVLALPGGYFVIAVEATVKQDSGSVVFFDHNGVFAASVKVGALPDMLTVTKDGTKVLVANEGEPNDAYTVDPEGSVSIIDISTSIQSLTQAQVKHLHFTSVPVVLNGAVMKPGVAAPVDLEPEYIAVNENSTRAVVACQENNLFVFIDLQADTVLHYKGLGFKDHSQQHNALDASNKDDAINIRNWPVKGVYQPDAIAYYRVGGQGYVLSANEGDARDYSGYSSETRIKDLLLDTVAFPNATGLQDEDSLGRLKTFTPEMLGDTDGDGDVDELYAYGARSFSIWDMQGNLVWDSGDDFEHYIAAHHATFFNCDDGRASEQDERSDDKGPEPEAVAVGEIGGRYYAFIGLERQGGIMVYDISNPQAPVFESFIHNYKGDGAMTDVGPEGLFFVPENASHNGKNMLFVSNEVSGTTTIYQLDQITGVEEKPLVFSVDVFPNPTFGNVRVSIDPFVGGTQYALYDASGQLMLTGTFVQESMQIALERFSSGIYLLRIWNEKHNYVSKRSLIKD